MGDSKAGPSGYLTTSEVMLLTGRTRKQLDTYIDKKIVTPARTSNSSHAEKHWTLEQASLVSHVPVLLRAGLSLEEIVQLADQGMQAVNAKLKAQYMLEMREGRRGLKDIVFRNREVSDTIGLGRRENPYLRYVPQRWLALAPVTHNDRLPGTPRHTCLYTDLRRTVEVLGWSLTESSGAITSLSADGRSGTFYSYAGLASPPMPAFTGPLIIDGGCYYAMDPKHGGPGCDGTRCDECARFGRAPTDAERFDWNVRQRTDPQLWDHTVMADDLDKPYPTGMWSEYTKRRFAQEGEDGAGEPEWKRGGTVKPRLMPHEVKLPLGVTACVLPAGVYLCYQCDEGGQEAAFQRMMGLSSAIKHREFTAEDELAASNSASRKMKRARQPESGPVSEPFAIPRAAGDPAMAGWCREVDQADLQQLVVPTNMALEPEDGCCVVCAALPSADRNDPTRYEMQLLVDAIRLTPPPPRLD